MNNELTHNAASVETIVHRTLLNLRHSTENIDDLLGSLWTERYLKQIFDQAADEILEIINDTPQGGYIVAQQLIDLLAHQDAGVRAVAASFCGLKGMPSNVVMEPLQNLFLKDDTLVVKMAAATHIQVLAASTYQIPRGADNVAQQFVEAFIQLARQEPGSVRFNLDSMKDKRSLYRDSSRENDPEMIIGNAVMNMIQMVQYMPRLIALQSVDECE